jgi:thiamine-phosphate pyrophosphorylase
MRWNKDICSKCKLYLILDRGVHSYDELLRIALDAVEGGVDIVQLRDKSGSARDIMAFSEKLQAVLKRRVPYIINDRVDLAVIAGADGVHLGQEDVPPRDARRMLGPDNLVGVSCQTWEQARQAADDGADYIGFGSVFETLTKPGRRPMDAALLEKVVRHSPVPVFPIGGITADRLEVLGRRGVRRVAVCRAISQALDVTNEARRFKTGLEALAITRM